MTREFARHGGGEYEGVPLDDEKQSMRAWFGFAEPFNWDKSRSFGPLLSTLIILVVGGLFFLAIAAAFKLLGSAVFGDLPKGAGSSFGLTGIIVAMIGAPFVVWRAFVAQKQVDVAEQGQITDRISKAVEGLGAEKTVNKLGREISYIIDSNQHREFEFQNRPFNVPETAENFHGSSWASYSVNEPNLEVRVGAIYALERIAADSRRDYRQIVEILCTYIRQNSPKEEYSNDEEPNILKLFQEPSLRVDVQTALTVLGRRTKKQIKYDEQAIQGHENFPYVFDLRNTNLKGATLSNLNLDRAFLLGSDLSAAFMVNTSLKRSSLNSCDLSNAFMMFAKLHHSKMSKVNLKGTSAEGVKFINVEFSDLLTDALTSTTGSDFSFSAIYSSKLARPAIDPRHFKVMYGDASVDYAYEFSFEETKAIERPPHWHNETQAHREFLNSWKKFKAGRNYNPT